MSTPRPPSLGWLDRLRDPQTGILKRLDNHAHYDLLMHDLAHDTVEHPYLATRQYTSDDKFYQIQETLQGYEPYRERSHLEKQDFPTLDRNRATLILPLDPAKGPLFRMETVTWVPKARKPTPMKDRQNHDFEQYLKPLYHYLETTRTKDFKVGMFHPNALMEKSGAPSLLIISTPMESESVLRYIQDQICTKYLQKAIQR